MDDSWYNEDSGHLVRPYAITGGRTRPQQDAFNIITHVAVKDPDADVSRLDPEPARIFQLCRSRPLSVAEIAAKVDLPVSVVKVLLGDLLESSMIVTRAPVAVAGNPDVVVLEAVMNGLRRL